VILNEEMVVDILNCCHVVAETFDLKGKCELTTITKEEEEEQPLSQGFPTCGPPSLRKWPSTSQKIKIKINMKNCKN